MTKRNYTPLYYWLPVSLISYGFAFLFLYAAGSKLLDFEQFKIQIGQSAMLTPYAGLIAWAVPAIEIFITILLIFEKPRLFGLYASFALMVMFTTYIFIILNYAEKIPCACGGVLSEMTWKQHFVFNGVFVLLGVVGVLLGPLCRKRHVSVEGRD